jgi:hypothetical protein
MNEIVVVLIDCWAKKIIQIIRKIMNIKQLLLGFFTLSISAPTFAVLIDHGGYLTDTNSGLDWLKPSYTLNQSFNNVYSHWVNDFSTEQIGLRFATASEFLELLAPINSAPPEQRYDKSNELISLLGITYSSTSPQVNGVFGMTASPSNPLIPELEGLFTSHDPNFDPSVDFLGWSPDPNRSYSDVGSFLVRSTLPHGVISDDPLMPVETNLGWNFSFGSLPDQQTFVDPLITTGYDYSVDTGPNFASVLLPSVGDDEFALYLWSNTEWIFDSMLHAGVEHFFGGSGADRFRIEGIETSAGLDPSNPRAFVTGLTFVDMGTINMSMIPLTAEGSVPEPNTLALLSLGSLIGLGFIRRRRVQMTYSW